MIQGRTQAASFIIHNLSFILSLPLPSPWLPLEEEGEAQAPWPCHCCPLPLGAKIFGGIFRPSGACIERGDFALDIRHPPGII
jgi:hypothetical protein